MKDPLYEPSCGNVFADLGIENPEEELTKAKPVWEIEQIIQKKRLTLNEATSLLGINQQQLSAFMSRKLDGFSIDSIILS